MESIYLLSKSHCNLLFLNFVDSKYKRVSSSIRNYEIRARSILEITIYPVGDAFLPSIRSWEPSFSPPRNYFDVSLCRFTSLRASAQTSLTLFEIRIRVPHTDSAPCVCQCWFSVRVGTRACAGEYNWRMCERLTA